MIDTQQFTNAGMASAETVFGLAGKTLAGVEQLTALNLQLSKSLLAEGAAQTQAALSAKSVDEFVKLQTAVYQAVPQKAAAYTRQVQEIATAVADAYRAVAEAQAADVQAKFLDAFDGALKNLPGSDETRALAKSAISAAKNAYEGVSSASKQVTNAVAEKIAKLAEPA